MDETIAVPNANLEHPGSSPLLIPTEICENIINMLFSYDPEDTLEDIATLHSCALVCGNWRVRSQRMLFYKVQLSDTTSFRRLSTILDDARHLRDYVYQVGLAGYHLHNTTSIFALFPAVFAGKLPNLFLIDVVHFSDSEKTPFPRVLGTQKAKALPYIPLHPQFSAFLSAFTAVSILYLEGTTFRTFSEFTRMIHGIPNLEALTCKSVNWISPGSSHPGAEFTKQPEWAAGKDTLPPFAPKLRRLSLWDFAMHEAKKLISTRGPHLICLSLTIPPSIKHKELAIGGGIDLNSCTALQVLTLCLAKQFSMDAHGWLVSKLLASWKPQDLHAILRFTVDVQCLITRQRFAEVLRGLGAITEAWLQTLQGPPCTGEVQDHRRVKYRIEVGIREWENKRKWWLDHLESCFPTWSKLGKLKLIIRPPRNAQNKWSNKKKPAKSDASGLSPSEVEVVNSSSVSKGVLSPKTEPV